jgi:hypothetical protein
VEMVTSTPRGDSKLGQRVITFHFVSFSCLFVVSTCPTNTNTTNISPSQHHQSLCSVYMYMHAPALTRMHETSHLPILPVQSDPARGIHVLFFRHPAAQACYLALGSAVLASGLAVYDH